MMKKTSIVATLVFFLIFGLGFGSSAAAKVIEWKAQTLLAPEDAGTVIQAQGLVNKTNEALKGKLHTTLYQNGQLVPADQMPAGLARGVYDAGFMIPQLRTNAGLVAFGLPFGLTTAEQVKEFWYDFGFLDFIRKLDAKQNIFFGCPLPFGPTTLFSKFPVRRIEDIKGKKIWSGGAEAPLIKALGGQPVYFDPGEVYMGLKLGTIDGVFFGPAELETLKLKEVVKYVMDPAPINALVCDWVISMDSWKKLTPEMQTTYEKTMQDFIIPQYDECQVFNDRGLKAAKAYGVEVITIEPEELKRFKKAAMDVWDHVAKKDKDAAKAVQMLKDYLKSKGITPGE